MRPIDAYKVRCERDDFDTYADYITAFDAINEAPTVELDVKWIPVTERLPERDDEYIATVTDGNYKWTSAVEYYSKFKNPWVSVGTVIAWAEFPKPYEVKE